MIPAAFAAGKQRQLVTRNDHTKQWGAVLPQSNVPNVWIAWSTIALTDSSSVTSITIGKHFT